MNTKTWMKLLVVTGFGMLILVLSGLGPLLTIWSMNSLFNAGIQITFANYFSVLWLQILSVLLIEGGTNLGIRKAVKVLKVKGTL